MNPQDIQSQIANLQRQIDDLKRSSSFPRGVETAIVERLKTVSSVGTTGSTTTASGYVEITLANGITYQILKV